MIQRVPIKNCVGCHACESVCKTEAIQLVMNKEGFLYPLLDETKCTQCKACLVVCPAENETCFERMHEPDVYASWNTSNEIRQISSSGGVFSELGKKILANSGIVYGAAFDRDLTLQHQEANSEDELQPLRGSKYVQSNLAGMFAKVQMRLKQDQQVLFVGTPCQIAGLNSFLRHDYSNLMTCDVICHGVAPPGVLARYIDELEKTHLAAVTSFQFRAKPQGWRDFFFDIRFDNGDKILEPFTNNPYMKGFLADLYLRPSCHQCKYSRLPRVADITLGDFWGIWEFRPEYESKKGISALLINSAKARNFLPGLDLVLHPAELDWVLKGNPSLVGAAKPHKRRSKFFTLFADGPSFETIINTCLPPTSYLEKVIWSIKRRFKRIIN